MSETSVVVDDGPWLDFEPSDSQVARGSQDEAATANQVRERIAPDAPGLDLDPGGDKPSANESFVGKLGRQLGLTARYGLEGAAQAAQLFTEPIRQNVTDPLAKSLGMSGGQPLGVMATEVADDLGLPHPESSFERVVGDAARMVSGAGATMGAGAAAAKLPGLVGKVGEAVAAQPLQQAVSAAGAGTAGGAARENGANEVVQAGAALVGGLGTAVAFDAAKRLGRAFLSPLMAQRAAQVDVRIEKALKSRDVDWAAVPEGIRQSLRFEVEKALKTGQDLNEAAVGRLLDFKRVPGTKPTRGSVSLDPVQITRERNLAKTGANTSDAGMQGLAQIESDNNRALIEALNDAGASTLDDAYASGQKVIDTLQSGLDAEKTSVNQLYGAARDSAGRSHPLDGHAFTQSASKALDDALLGHALPPSVAEHLNRIAKGEVPFTVDYAEQLKTAMGNLRRASTDGQTRLALDKVRQALDDAPVLGVGGQTPAAGARAVNPEGMPLVPNAPELGQEAVERFNAARAANRTMMQRVENNPALKAIYDGDVTPEDFVRKFVIGPGAKVDSVRSLGAEIANDAEAMQAVRGSIATWLKARALGSGATEETARFSAGRFQAALGSLGDRKLAVFFSPEEVEQLKAIGRVATYTTAQPAGSAVNNSNSGALLMGKGLDWLDSMASKVPLFGLGPQVSAVTRGVQESQAKNLTQALVNQGAKEASAPLLSPAVISGSLFSLPGSEHGQDEHGAKPTDEIGIETPQGAVHETNVSGPWEDDYGTAPAPVGAPQDADNGDGAVIREEAAPDLHIQSLRDAGEDTIADLLQRKFDTRRGEADAARELNLFEQVAHASVIHADSAFKTGYRALRVAGVKPAEAAGRAAVDARVSSVGQGLGLSAKAIQAMQAKAKELPAEALPGFVQRALTGFADRGLIQHPQQDVSPELEMAFEHAALMAAQSLYYGKPSEQADSDTWQQEATQRQPLDTGTNGRPVRPQATPIDLAAHGAATSPVNARAEPTEAQQRAGNYAKGHMKLAGLDVSIENPAGSVRRGIGADGQPWESQMRGAHYGYVRGSKGADNEHHDVFVKEGTPPDYVGPVFVVDQIDPHGGRFDEHKSIIGAADEADAEKLYRAAYDPDWQGFGAITKLPAPVFRAWVTSRHAKEPLGDISAAIASITHAEGGARPSPRRLSETPAITLVPRADGTLLVHGDGEAIGDKLRHNGIDRLMQVRGGVLVGRTMANQAKDLLGAVEG